MKNKQLFALLTASAILLTCCASAPGNATDTGQSMEPAQVAPADVAPFPSPVPGLQPSPDTPAAPLPPISTIASTKTTVESKRPGWTTHVSINQVRDVAFAPDSTLWAGTSGGLVGWDLTNGTYVRYRINVRSITAAPDGTLWLATEYGLCHFTPAGQDSDANGSCRNYSEQDGLLDEDVRALAIGDDGVLWVGTESGISRFDGRVWTNYPSPAPTTDLALGPSGEVWQATSAGIGRYFPQQDVWKTYGLESGLPDTNAQLIATGPDGQVWAYVAWQGIFRFDQSGVETGASWIPVEEPPGGLVGAISFSADGTPWVATIGSLHFPGGALAFHDGLRWVDTVSGSTFTPSRALATGPDGQIAASMSQGLAVYAEGKWRLLRDGPAHDRATSVAVTPDGAVWFAFGDNSTSSPGVGLSRFSFPPDSPEDSWHWSYHLEDAEVNALAVARDGSLWAATQREIQRFDGTTWQTVAECSDHRDCGVLDLAFTPDGSLWAANGFSVARLSDASGTTTDGSSWTRYDKMGHSLFAAPEGVIWMNGWEGTQSSHYVAHTDGKSWTIFRSADAYPGTFAVQAVSGDGRVWGIVPEIGLASFRGAAGADSSQPHDDVSAADETASWSGSEAWSIYPPPEGISLLSIGAGAPDSSLWLSTDHGIARFDPSIDPYAANENLPEAAWTLYHWDEATRSRPGPMAFGPDGADLWIGTTLLRTREVQPQQPRPAAPTGPADSQNPETYSGMPHIPRSIYLSSTNRDASEIARGAWRLDPESSQIERVTTPDTDVTAFDVWPGDGRTAYGTAKGQLFVHPLGGQPHLLFDAQTRTNLRAEITSVAWSPTGERIAFSLRVFPPQNTDSVDGAEQLGGLWTVNPGDGTPAKMLNDKYLCLKDDHIDPQDLRIYADPDWSPDGTALLLAGHYWEWSDVLFLDPSVAAPSAAMLRDPPVELRDGSWMRDSQAALLFNPNYSHYGDLVRVRRDTLEMDVLIQGKVEGFFVHAAQELPDGIAFVASSIQVEGLQDTRLYLGQQPEQGFEYAPIGPHHDLCRDGYLSDIAWEPESGLAIISCQQGVQIVSLDGSVDVDVTPLLGPLAGEKNLAVFWGEPASTIGSSVPDGQRTALRLTTPTPTPDFRLLHKELTRGPQPTPTQASDARCQQEWERSSMEIAESWQAAVDAANIMGLVSSSASTMGECITDKDGTVAFSPNSTWFYIAISTEGPNYDQLGDSLMKSLELLVSSFPEKDLPGSNALSYGTLSAYDIDGSGWPGEWIHYFSLSYEDAQAVSEAGLAGQAVLDALDIITPAQAP